MNTTKLYALFDCVTVLISVGSVLAAIYFAAVNIHQ